MSTISIVAFAAPRPDATRPALPPSPLYLRAPFATQPPLPPSRLCITSGEQGSLRHDEHQQTLLKHDTIDPDAPERTAVSTERAVAAFTACDSGLRRFWLDRQGLVTAPYEQAR